MFGLSSLQQLLMGNASVNEMYSQMTMGMDPSAGGMAGQPKEWGNMFKAEK